MIGEQAVRVLSGCVAGGGCGSAPVPETSAPLAAGLWLQRGHARGRRGRRPGARGHPPE